jgi:hypothetical protein
VAGPLVNVLKEMPVNRFQVSRIELPGGAAAEPKLDEPPVNIIGLQGLELLVAGRPEFVFQTSVRTIV